MAADEKHAEAAAEQAAAEAAERSADAAGADEAAGAAEDAQAAAEAGGAEGEAEPEAQADGEAMPESAEDILASAQAQVAEWQDKYLRLHAEWDTYRRRTNEQREEERKRATEGLVESLLPVLDDFERSIDYAVENGEAGLLEGVQKVHAKFVEVFEKAGVAVIDPAGEAFDALSAQAVATVPDDEAFDETVRDVYQKGYRMGKKVIRPAMVTVTTGGPKRPKDDEAAAE